MIVVSEDIPNCPGCGAVARKTDDLHRICTTCGLAWERKTPEDEADEEADRLVRSRGWNEEKKGRTPIGRGQMRW